MNENDVCGEPLYSEVYEVNTTNRPINKEYGFAFKVSKLPKPEEKIYFLPPCSAIYNNTSNSQEHQYESIELSETQNTIQLGLQTRNTNDLEAKRFLDKTVISKKY
ncbi:hypothetical protein COBT_003200, partial [Conglomerata obtusa]